MCEYTDLKVYMQLLNECLTKEQEERLEKLPWKTYAFERRQKALMWLKISVDKGCVDPEDKHVQKLLEELRDL